MTTQEQYDNKTYSLFESEDLNEVLRDLELQHLESRKQGFRTNELTKRINSIKRLISDSSK